MFKQAFLMLAILGITVGSPCFAHAKLRSSSPAANAQLTDAPKSITLKFDEAVQLAVLKLATGGQEIPVAIDKAAKADPSFTAALPALVPGKYTVQWTAISADDGHVTKGTFAFSIVSSTPTSH